MVVIFMDLNSALSHVLLVTGGCHILTFLNCV